MIEITEQHAESLVSLLRWFREMIAQFHEHNACDKHGSEKSLTMIYCDEMIEALKGNEREENTQTKEKDHGRKQEIEE